MAAVLPAANASAQSGDWGIFIDSNASAFAGPLHASGKLAYCTGSRYANMSADKPCGYTPVGGVAGGVQSQYFDDRTSLTLDQLAKADYAYRHLDGRYDYAFGRGRTNAQADLSDGTIRFGTSGDGGGNVGGGGVGVINQVSMFDTITFAGLTAPTQIGFDIRVDGSFAGGAQPRFGFQFYSWRSLRADARLLTGVVGWTEVGSSAPTTTATPGALFMDGFGTGRTGNWTTFGPDHFVGTVTIDPLDPTYFFNMYMSGANFTEFGHTAQITWDLPEGLSFSSASGSFLTAPTGVPEPATWAMLIAGFGMIGGTMRRQRPAERCPA